MNLSKFTQKSMEALQSCQQTAQTYGNAQIEQIHLLHALVEQDPEIGGAKLVIGMVGGQPQAAGIEGVRLAHGDAAAHVLPLALVHAEGMLHGGEVLLVPAGEGDGDIPGLISMLDRDTVMTIEPHLMVFAGYDKIDGEKMNHKFYFESNSQAFDAAVASLKGIFNNQGFTEIEGGFTK